MAKLLSLSKLARRLPGTSRGRLHPATLSRWHLAGLKGVHLEARRVGGRLFSTRQWVREFLAAVEAQSRPRPVYVESPAQRRRANAAVEAELDRLGAW